MADDIFSRDEAETDGASRPAGNTASQPCPSEAEPPKPEQRFVRQRPTVPSNIPIPKPAPKPKPEYEVGYRKPPEHTRFTPGRSGNPPGRRKGEKNTATIARELLNECIPVKVRGVARNQPMREVLVRTMMKKAAEKGDIKAFELVLKLSGEPISSASASGDGSGSSDEARFEPSSAEREMLAFHYRELLVGAGVEPATIERLLSAMIGIAPVDRETGEDE
jgi:hypothetical protein